MKFYIASSFKNIGKVKYVNERLKAGGFIHTYDWTQNERAVTIEQLRDIGTKEKEAVMEADVIAVLLPAGKGSHIELGIALGQGKRIYLYSESDDINNPETTSTFYHLPQVEKYSGTLDEFIDFLIEGVKDDQSSYI
ncbi:hypothetical protein EV207_1668 [Scopulibacillus darangshiensis]|uniref:Nucleoside 2-deoxyribosyltransferase-like protein n=1 Tax=Scopulibacillus darangshiensis TaxID=442528 RepID=A0A4R2NDI4_9BACL|nr:group-specific protein [Scopulibacillus darangshiensis]TCP19144.1 hypothetical protein EV207_1668 [Scopulibacillus darangshiensis]